MSGSVGAQAMVQAEVDVNKMPLGAISKAQVKKGFEVLEQIDAALKANNTKDLDDLSSRCADCVS